MSHPVLGQFVVSIDLEMSWGSRHHGRPHDASPYAMEREVVSMTLELFEQHQISATWAVVGHLFLSECDRAEAGSHPDVVSPRYDWLGEDWYELDPATSIREDPTWYGADLVADIQACRVPQELASHSFGHIIAGDPGCSSEAFRSDLVAARSVAESAGVDLESFVFPRNSVGHLGVLAEEGFKVYRGPTPDPFPTSSSWRRRLKSGWEKVVPTAEFGATREGALVNVPHTYLFDPGSSMANRIGTTAWTWLLRRRLRHAVRTGSLFHLWFHSHNLASDIERARQGLNSVLGLARREIDSGRLVNHTMSDYGGLLPPGVSGGAAA